MKKILVTGSAGFIGFHLVQRLIQEGDWDIVGIDNINDYYDVNLKYARLEETGISREKIEYNKIIRSNKSENYHFIKLDLLDKKSVHEIFKNEKFDYVVHLAAQAGVRYSLENPFAYMDSNLYAFLNILEGCRYNPIKHLIFASSSSVYGSNKKVPFSEDDNVDHPISLYAATKRSNELMAHTYSHLFGIPMTGLRFFTVYGPWGRPDMAIFIFTKAILSGKPINVYNYGKMKRDFTYIDDIVEGVFRLIEKKPEKNINQAENDTDTKASPAPYRILNIGNNQPLELTYLIEQLEKSLGKKAQKKLLPLQPGDVIETYADVNNLHKIINFKPETSIEFGIKKFTQWYLNFYHLNNNKL